MYSERLMSAERIWDHALLIQAHVITNAGCQAEHVSSMPSICAALQDIGLPLENNFEPLDLGRPVGRPAT